MTRTARTSTLLLIVTGAFAAITSGATAAEPVPEATLDSAQALVTEVAAARGLGDFAIYTNPGRGEVVYAGAGLEADDTAALRGAARPATLVVAPDQHPRLVGAGYRIFMGDQFLCSSGFDVADNATGTLLGLTAGHCGDIGTEVTLDGVSLGLVQGSSFSAPETFSDSAIFGPVPAEYATATTFTGADVQLPIKGALLNRAIRRGAKICFSGATTARQTCGPVIRENVALRVDNGQLIRSNACVAARVRSGDSGGPVYQRRAVGIFAAGLISSGLRIRFRHRNIPIACFTKIADALRLWNVSILTA